MKRKPEFKQHWIIPTIVNIISLLLPFITGVAKALILIFSLILSLVVYTVRLKFYSIHLETTLAEKNEILAKLNDSHNEIKRELNRSTYYNESISNFLFHFLRYLNDLKSHLPDNKYGEIKRSLIKDILDTYLLLKSEYLNKYRKD